MSNNDYSASVVVETATAIKGVQDLSKATSTAATTFADLGKVLKGSNTNLKDAAAALKSIVASSREASAATKDEAAARIANARAAGQEARTLQQAAAASERGALANQRVATSAAQAAAAEARRANTVAAGTRATERATAAAERNAAAQTRAASASLEVTDHLSNSRYLLYDVASTYTMLSAALLAVPAATAAVAISYEKDFAQVLRTTESMGGNVEMVESLRGSLKELATEIPIAFGELSNISSIGGQLGIANDQIDEFTETVAKFGAASNVSTDEAATAFGRLQNSFPKDAQAADYFNKIGSAIAYVGVKSVASESEILAIVNQLSPLAAQSGFAASEVVGLSGALASVRIRPELARGAFLSTMTKMTNAADEGSVAFEGYAKYLDMTGEAGLELFKTDPSAFFTQFIGGIKGAIDGGQSFSSVMADLGVKEKRETQFLLALSNGYNVLEDAMGNADKAYTEGTFLDSSTAVVFETVAATLTRVGNAVKNLMDSIGGSGLGPVKALLDGVLGLVTGFTALIDTFPAVGAGINVLLGIGAVVGVMLAFKAAQAAALAAVVAFRQVVGSGIATSISFSGVLKELSVTMLQARGATLAQAQAFVQANGAMAAYRTGTLATNVANRQLTISSATAATGMGRLAGSARTAGTALLGAVGGPIGLAITALALLGGAFLTAGMQAKESGKAIAEGMAQGEDAGNKAIAEALTASTVGLGKTGASALTDWGKNMRELGEQAGVSMEAMVMAVAKGEGAVLELDKTLDMVAQKKGFDSFADWDAQSNSGFDTQLNNLKDIRAAVEEAGTNSAKSAKDLDGVTTATENLGNAAAAAAPAVDENGDAIGSTAEEADDAARAINEYVAALFGIVNGEAAANAALQKLGEGLAESSSLSTGDEGGRENLANLQDTLAKAAQYQQQLIDAGEQSAAQAQANYAAFVEGLYAELTSRGVDIAAVQGLADQTKSVFNAAVADENAANMAVTASVDTSSVDAAKNFLMNTFNQYGTLDATVLVKQEGGEQVAADVTAMQNYISSVTGHPYVFVADADVAPATGNLAIASDYALAIASGFYNMSVGADISPATAALQALQQFAASVVNSIIDKMNAVGGVLGKPRIGNVGWGGSAAPVAAAPAPVARVAPTLPSAPKAALSLGAPSGAAAGLDNLAKGYDKAGQAAGKAGGAGEKAGKDMANGIDEATEAVNDYANRLSQGLKSAFDKQYGLQAATDDYYSALNAITDKRKEDLKSIEDLIAKTKELNNERDKDLVDANKAKIEKDISIKYGEGDRAADYANQEQTALDNAAAKLKDIEATKASQLALEQGLNALTGYSTAAIANRAALRDLESKMLDMVTAYAATGASQNQVDAYTRNLTAQFGVQVGQIGYTRSAVTNLQGDMTRYIAVVRSVPTRVNTDVGTSGTGGSTGALNGVRNAVNGIPNNKHVTVSATIEYLPVKDSFGSLKGLREIVNGKVQPGVQLAFNGGGQVPGFASGGRVPGQSPANPRTDNMLAKVDGKGVVGIRSNEWIIQEPAVKHYGSTFMDDLNNMRLPKFNTGGTPSGYSGSGGGSADSMVVALDASTMAAFQKFMSNPVNLYTSDELIASTANKGNVVLASKGVA